MGTDLQLTHTHSRLHSQDVVRSILRLHQSLQMGVRFKALCEGVTESWCKIVQAENLLTGIKATHNNAVRVGSLALSRLSAKRTSLRSHVNACAIIRVT